MTLPEPVFDPPFNILRTSHVILNSTDLEASRKFYETTLGLHVTYADDEMLCFRGMEERNHHSLLLRKGDSAHCETLGFKVGSDKDLELALAHFQSLGLPAEKTDSPKLGAAVRVASPGGIPMEFVHQVAQEKPLLQEYGEYRGAHPLRIDHFNCFADDVQASVDFFNSLGFRVTEYTASDDGDEIWAAWMHRKGDVHDVAFTNGMGPRLHHVAFWVPTAMNIIHLCDVMATTGYLENMERGPGRHGISNAFFLYVRDPDGHRIEFYTSDYLTIDTDHKPIRWALSDPRRQTLWGMPAPRSWFEEGSGFAGVKARPPKLKAQPIIAD